MDETTARSLISYARVLTAKDDKDNADSVLHLAMIENEAIFKKLREVPEMNEALIKLM